MNISKLDEYCQLRNLSIVINRKNQLTGFKGGDYRLFEIVNQKLKSPILANGSLFKKNHSPFV